MKILFSKLKSLIKKNRYIEIISRYLVSLVPYKFRKLDKEFWRYYHFLFELEKKSISEVQEYQFKNLKQIVESAYEYSTFYRRKYDSAGFHPDFLKTLADINKIPVLTKDEVRHFSNEMLLSKFDKKSLHLAVTAGTTGKALKFYHNQEIESQEWASICYQWNRVGYLPGDGRIELRGAFSDDSDFVFKPDEKMLRINIVKMSKDNIYNILKKIKSLDYKFIHGYPSAVYKFANLIKKNNISFKPQGIMMASEVVYEWQMSVIDDVFNCPKIAHFGLAEKVALAAWDKDRKYYFMPSYGIVEYDKSNLELIGTSLINKIVPFIRYKMTDSIENFQELSDTNNKTLFPIVDVIHGRDADFTYNENGGIVSPALVTFPFNKLVTIESVKIVQLDIGQFNLIFETKRDLEDMLLQSEVAKMIEDLKSIYGKNSSFNVIYVDRIPIDKSGKFRWVECKINA